MSGDEFGSCYQPTLSWCAVPGCGRMIWSVNGNWTHGLTRSEQPADGHEATNRAPTAGHVSGGGGS